MARGMRLRKDRISCQFRPVWNVLVEMSGRWTKHEPMAGKDFDLLVG